MIGLSALKSLEVGKIHPSVGLPWLISKAFKHWAVDSLLATEPPPWAPTAAACASVLTMIIESTVAEGLLAPLSHWTLSSLGTSDVSFSVPLAPSLMLVWLTGLGAGLWTERLLLRFPVRARAWVVGLVPSRGCARGNHALMFPSLSFSFPSSLSKNK